MKIDLDNKIARFLVQEYINQICNFSSEEELGYDLHKLIHSFDVVEMAKNLIRLSKPSLSKSIQQHIIDAALLHDIGRCHEFKKGIRSKNIDHGKIGANLILKKFPKMGIEIQSTLYHNKCPSSKDPKLCFPVLDYVRDADMLANIQYEITHTNTWLNHILGNKKNQYFSPIIDQEVLQAVKEKRPPRIKDMKTKNLLSLWAWQLCWVFNLRTAAGIDFSKKKKLFPTFRTLICEKIVPMTQANKQKQKELIQIIQKNFPDTIFL